MRRSFLLLGLVSSTGWCFELQPISREFTPSGSGAVQSYLVSNPATEPIAINITVETRALDVEGLETNRSAENDFLIYPPQFIVGPGKRQTVRVTWLGDPTAPRELAYRLVVEQLPIERLLPSATGAGPVQARVVVLTRYKGSLYVKPPHAQPRLVVASAQLASRSLLAVTVKNEGTGRVALKDVKFKVKTGELLTVFKTADLALKSSVLLPGGERRLLFPWPEGLALGAVAATITP